MNRETHEQSSSDQSASVDQDLDHVMRVRLEKLDRLRAMGCDPYPPVSRRTHSLAAVLEAFDELTASAAQVTIAGRIMSIRVMGKSAFCHLQEESARLQIYLKMDEIGADRWELFKLLDIGDIVETSGSPFITRTGERSLKCRTLTLLSKNIRPLPAVKEKGDQTWYRWDDKEERYRRRHIDLILNRESRDVLSSRSRVVQEMRDVLREEGFLEVETPVLQPLYGGAAAEPFTTHYNALDREFYLRIADELYLKRLIVGGFNRVFEIAKNFRNEGIDRMHSPEFTMMECYAAFEDYTFCMELIERMMPRLAAAASGSSQVSFRQEKIDFTPPYRRAAMADLVREACGIGIVNRERDEIAAEAAKAGVPVEKSWGVGKIIDELFSAKVQPNLIQPTFVTDYPVELSPLAKRHRTEPGLVERFELFAGGFELGNSFTELNDPIDQRMRFEEQVKLRAAGDTEAHPVDEDFLHALETGMPPTAGLGMGVDRLVMILTGAWSLREVILFPALKTKE